MVLQPQPLLQFSVHLCTSHMASHSACSTYKASMLFDDTQGFFMQGPQAAALLQCTFSMLTLTALSIVLPSGHTSVQSQLHTPWRSA